MCFTYESFVEEVFGCCKDVWELPHLATTNTKSLFSAIFLFFCWCCRGVLSTCWMSGPVTLTRHPSHLLGYWMIAALPRLGFPCSSARNSFIFYLHIFWWFLSIMSKWLLYQRLQNLFSSLTLPLSTCVGFGKSSLLSLFSHLCNRCYYLPNPLWIKREWRHKFVNYTGTKNSIVFIPSGPYF